MRMIRVTLLLLITLISVLFSASFVHSITEQIVSKRNSDSFTGYVAAAPAARNQNANDAGSAVALPKDETSSSTPARNVVLGFVTLAFVALAGFLVSQYSPNTNTKKGTVGRGPSARTRVIRSLGRNHDEVQTTAQPRAPTTAYTTTQSAKKSTKTKFRRGVTGLSRELDAYLRGRKRQATMQVKTAERSSTNVSSYEDEYWQHQKESFWKRVRKAADAPMTIQQLAVKRVQHYTEKMAEIRKAKEDLYEQKEKTVTEQAAKDVDVDVQVQSDVGEKSFSRWGGPTRREGQQLIIDQLREAHYYE